MNIEQILRIILYAGIALAAVLALGRFILIEVRTHRNREAPVETGRAIAWFKHPDMVPVLAGRGSTYIYCISFRTETGLEVKLYMTPDAYYRIPEGAESELIWQGEKLWRFTLEDGTEIRQ